MALVKVKRWIDDKTANKVTKAGLSGIWVAEDNQRYYPYGNFASYVLGHTSSDSSGVAGIELKYDGVLKGTAGKLVVSTDAAGKEIPQGSEQYYEPTTGNGLVLTIDEVIQHYCEKAAQKAYEENNATKVTIIAMDPKTGDIKAMVKKPDYNPNTPTKAIYPYYEKILEECKDDDKKTMAAYSNMWRNTAISDTYEPGSTFKLITAAIGLENGTLDPIEIKTINGREWQKDSSWGNYHIRRINAQTNVALKEAVKYSDNIYFGMNALEMGSEALIKGAEQFTIGTDLAIGYPIKQSQISNNGTLNRDILLADTGYGQGEIMVSTLNMALAYSALSNSGNIMAPTLILTDNHQPSVLKESVISTQNLSILQDAFSAVVEDSDGTGHLAKIDGIKLAGKTGTAEIKSSQGETGSENGWFIATDLDSSNVSIAMVVEDVQEGVGTLGVVSMVKEVLLDYLK